ncbi:Hypothetical protein SMAX5B_012782 [Scophthalmus maximus]|uniref:Ig-like domain-containing protein n=1 Tax=Scophthalmus maximus TaxID=52904 RepID=A0A2U9BZA5_SCOMX|nr:Hypothetical protein SMAX5B_012782 [Scophthalmus maximus]
MTSLWCLGVLLVLLLLHQAHGEEPEPEPVFRAKGSVIEIGYCFGVDYIAVYRSFPEGDQLLGNSSANNTAGTPPADLQDRARLSQHHHLLGLQIRNLTRMDSGMYRRECWQNQKLVSQLTQQLSVCDEEVESEEIVVKEGAAAVELRCNSTSSGLEGTSVHWYHEMYPFYKLTRFLDSSVSLEPLVEEMKGVVEVRDGGALLVLDNRVLKKSQHFHCLVVEGKNCLSFQNMYLPDHTESKDIFASQGDRVVLKCPSDGNNQQWDTPLGKINGSSTRNSQVSISVGDESGDFSLIISAVTDEHSGEYSCISSSLELQYLLVLCPKKKAQDKVDFEGGNFSLECKVSQDDSHRVQWYHTDTSGEYKLIHDSNDKTVPGLEDPKGRVTVYNNGSLLTISSVEMKDAGVYWCVVLAAGGPIFLEDDDFKYDYNGEDTEVDEYGDEPYWDSAHRCILKQETVVTLIKSATFEPGTRNLDASPTADPSAASNVAAYAAGAGVAALVLVVGAIAVGIAVKKRRATSRLNADKGINLNEDPRCTQGLTSDECGA